MLKRKLKKNKQVGMIFLVGFVLLITGCVDITENDQLSVLVTIVPQVEMVSSIGGDFVDVTVMVPAGESPHSFEPKPLQMTKVAKAKAYFTVGSGVEFEIVQLNTILEQNPDLMVYDCSENITVLSFDQHYGGKTHHAEELQHGGHDGTDPHIWTTPVNMKKMADVVYQGLVEIDPDHQQDYFQNYLNYSQQLDSLHQNISSLLLPHEGRSFMVYHPAWGYFSDTYKLNMIAIEDDGKKPGIPGVAAIVEQAKTENISVIFVSPQFDTSSAEIIAEEIDGTVAFANPLMSDYSQTLTALAETVANTYSSEG